MTGAEPHFLGPRLPIEGDGRVTWGLDHKTGNLTVASRTTRLP